MPRIPRIVLVGYPHHVTQRGNDRCDVFFSDEDHRTYLGLLKKQTNRYELEVVGYCLLSNHVHLIVIPRALDARAKAIGRTHFQYTQHVNRDHGRSGHLWQNRFYSCPLE
ncbi:MAG: transposase [Candidatus Eisenbacteria bacterium]